MQAALLALAVLRLGLRLEAGPEFDSNANHVPTPRLTLEPAPIASGLVRATARGRLTWTGAASTLRLTLDLGGKLFFDDAAQPQNVLVVRLSGEVRREMGPLSLGLGIDYHDAWQWITCRPIRDEQGMVLYADDTSCHRDFRLGALRAFAAIRDGAPSITAEAMVRGYQWKPYEDLTFLGVGGSLAPGARLHSGREREHEWTLSAPARVEWRRYAGAALLSPTDIGNDPTAPRRTDLVVSLGARASYFGKVFASLGWYIESDRSTSFGASLLYQAVSADAAVPLPAKLTLGARAQLLFFDKGALPISLAVEDENRDAFMVDLARDFGHGLSVRARYQLFFSPPGSSATGYQRHVASLALSWQVP